MLAHYSSCSSTKVTSKDWIERNTGHIPHIHTHTHTHTHTHIRHIADAPQNNGLHYQDKQLIYKAMWQNETDKKPASSQFSLRSLCFILTLLYSFFPVPVCAITASGVPGGTFVSTNRFRHSPSATSVSAAKKKTHSFLEHLQKNCLLWGYFFNRRSVHIYYLLYFVPLIVFLLVLYIFIVSRVAQSL
jgi:hypothetical protein